MVMRWFGIALAISRRKRLRQAMFSATERAITQTGRSLINGSNRSLNTTDTLDILVS